MENKSAREFVRGASDALLAVIVLALPGLYVFGGKIMEVTSTKPMPVLVPTATVTLVPEVVRQMANTPADMLPAMIFGIFGIALPIAYVLYRIDITNKNRMLK